jgi:hypothetical protein
MDKTNLQNCLNEISTTIKTFLAEEGGYSNGYYTYVEGTITAKGNTGLKWDTPQAKEELTDRGKDIRGDRLYKSIQEILKVWHVDKVLIRSKDENFGAMETEIVYVEETVKRVWL